MASITLSSCTALRVPRAFRPGMGRAAHLPPGPDPRSRTSVRMRAMRLRLTIAVLVLLLAPVAQAAAPTLPARLAKALAVPNIAPAASGAIAVDLRTFGVLFAQNADTPLLPASNEKLAVTFAALRELGPYYRFRTEVLGAGYRNGPIWVGDLVLKGYG